jgi:hypothetical protein
VIFGLAIAPATGLFPAFMNGVYSRPGASLGLVLGSSAFLVAFLYVLGLPFLFVCVFRFVTAWHFSSW